MLSFTLFSAIGVYCQLIPSCRLPRSSDVISLQFTRWTVFSSGKFLCVAVASTLVAFFAVEVLLSCTDHDGTALCPCPWLDIHNAGLALVLFVRILVPRRREAVRIRGRSIAAVRKPARTAVRRVAGVRAMGGLRRRVFLRFDLLQLKAK